MRVCIFDPHSNRKLFCQKNGHKPVVVMGGGTTKVGDPSGKDDTRTMMGDDQIQHNIKSIGRVFEKFLTFGDGPTDAIIIDNSTWLDEFKYLEFLREYGPHFSVNRMLTFESVRQRLDREQPLSFLEFNYMLLQAVDFLELHRRHQVRLQIGGSDQWGNIVNGVELGRRIDQIPLFGLTAPLVVTSDGKKMGKSVNGAVWLDADLLSEYDYWQFWRNTSDQDTIKFLKLFTEVPDVDLAELEKLEGAALNDAKVLLADEATRMLHGEGQLQKVKQTIDNVFSGQSDASTGALPQVVVTSDQLELAEGLSVVDCFVELKLCKSKAETKRLIKGKGARINGEQITDQKMQLQLEHFDGGCEVRLSAGKKRHGVVVLET